MKTKKMRGKIQSAINSITKNFTQSDKEEYNVLINNLEKIEGKRYRIIYQLECIPFPDCCEGERHEEIIEIN